MEKKPCDDLAEYMRQNPKPRQVWDERRYARVKGTVIIFALAIAMVFITLSILEK